MSTILASNLDFSSLSLYKLKSNSLSNQNERRSQILKQQKEKREQVLSQLRFQANDNSNNNNGDDDDDDNDSIQQKKPQWPPRQHKKSKALTCPIGMMLAEWLFSPPDDISSWFIIPCPLGQRSLVVVQSHRTYIYGKYGNLVCTMFTKLPKQTILYCIYDNRSKMYFIIDIIMWNGQDYSTQIECQCRFFILLSLNDDNRLNEQFKILPRFKIEDKQEFLEAEDGYLFYHPLGFYESDYSPLVCWLKPFMIEEILGINLSYPIEKPIGYTTAQAYMLEEQLNRKEQQQQQYVRKSHRKKKEEQNENTMSVD